MLLEKDVVFVFCSVIGFKLTSDSKDVNLLKSIFLFWFRISLNMSAVLWESGGSASGSVNFKVGGGSSVQRNKSNISI